MCLTLAIRPGEQASDKALFDDSHKKFELRNAGFFYNKHAYKYTEVLHISYEGTITVRHCLRSTKLRACYFRQGFGSPNAPWRYLKAKKRIE